MAYIIIILGAVLLGTGVYMLTASKSTSQVEGKQATSKEKGNDFEEFVIQKVGNIPGAALVSKNSDYHNGIVSAEENSEPDLKFRMFETPIAIECKWRSYFKDGQVIWAKKYQVDNYFKYQREAKQDVFIALGVGGSPSRPTKFYLIPLYRLTKNFATEEYISEFLVDVNSTLYFNPDKKLFATN